MTEEILNMVKVFSYKEVNKSNDDISNSAPRLIEILPHIAMVNNLNEIHTHVSLWPHHQ